MQRGRNGSTRLRHVPRRSQLVASHLVDDNERLKTEVEDLKKEQAKLRAQLKLQTTTEQPKKSKTSGGGRDL